MSKLRQTHKQAAQWYVLLASGEMSAEEIHQWEIWRAAQPENAAAWAKLEALRGKLQQVPPALARSRWQTRQHSTLKAALVLILGCGALWPLLQHEWPTPAQTLITQTGERQEFTLADGSRVRLNTHSRLIATYDRKERLLRLEEGEIEVRTAPDAKQRPFFVETRDGRMQALGTRFSVRLEASETALAVQEHAVLISPAANSAPQRLEAGQTIRFSAQRYEPITQSSGFETAWTQGKLIVLNRRLDEVIRELDRHFDGTLSYVPAIAHLRVSGTFSLDHPERSLETIAATLPIRVERIDPKRISLTKK